MIKKVFHIIICLLIFFLTNNIFSQTNPTAQSLPYSQNFGTSTFSTLSAGSAVWIVNSSPIGTQSNAESSTTNGDASVTAASTTQTTGGVYGYATSSNGRLYIQTSSNATNGTSQFALAINTTGKTNIKVSYDIEMISVTGRTIGDELQYRVGTLGSWTALSGTIYSHNSIDRSNGSIDHFTNIALPSGAENQSVVQLRWVTWRGSESGNSSGLGIDNISITSGLSLTVNSATVCTGASATLIASGATTYSWSPSTGLNTTTGATVTATPTATIVYTVTGTTGSATATATSTVTVNALPTLTITPSTATVCAGSSTTLTASGASIYSWSPSSSLSSGTGASVIATPTANTTYTITGTNSNGCINTNTAVVTVNPVNSITVTPSSATVCAGSQTNLVASGVSSYNWAPGASLNTTTSATVTATPTTTTTYTVTGDCNQTKTVVVTVNALPSLTITPSSTTICSGNSTTLTASGGNTYSWLPSSSLSSSTGASVTANPTATTTYTLIGTNSNGCVNTKTVTATVNATPTVSVSSYSISPGATTTLTAGGASTYNWAPSTGLSATTGSIVTASPTATTVYTITGTTGSCSSQTTATVSVIALYYRSTTSGNWNSTSTWQSSADNSTWVSATAPPDYNSNTITIQSAHVVTITASVTFDQTIVNGTLVYGNNAGSVITINDGAGIDLTVNGTYQDIGPSSNVWSGSATWSMGSSGTLLRTRGTSSSNWRDKYDGGISTIPATANWIVRKTGSDNPSISSTGGMYYPNLTIENTSGSSWTTASSSEFTGSSDYPRIKGDFNVGGSGTSPVIFIDTNTNVSPTLIQGKLTVQSGSILRNAGTGLEVQKDMQVDGTLLYGTGNNRTLNFSGANAQTLSGVGTVNIYALIINKSANALTLSKAITVDNTLTLTSGNIASTSTNLLTLKNGTTVSGASSSSFVSGPVKKTGNSAFTFPIGKGSNYQPATITAPSSSTDAFTAEYFASAQTDGPSADSTVYQLSICEYWNVARTTGTSNISLTLGWNASSCNVISPISDMRIAHWSSSTSNWNDEGGTGSTGNTTAGTITTTSAQSSFGDFILANKATASSTYFRSITSGNWNVISTWQESEDNLTWVAASSTPDYNDNTITIQSGHVVTITASATLDQTIVNGTLVYGDNVGSVITINDGTGIDLTINGTYQDIGPSSNVWLGSATWVMSSTGTLLRTRGTSSDNWRDKYNGGISTIPARANWIIRKTGSDNPTLSSVGGMYYPNLTIENTSGSTWTTASSSEFTGSSDYPRIKGNFDVGGTGTNAVVFISQNTNATPILVQGNLTVESGSTLQNNGTGLEVQKDMQVNGILLYGTINNRMVIFSGTNTQTLSGSGTINIFSLKINKASNALTLSKAITVDNSLTLSSGNIISTSTSLLTLNTNAISSGASNSSFVAGPIQKIGNAAFTFPTGKGTNYQPIGISAPAHITDAFTAEYINMGQTLGTAADSTIDSLSTCEYWNLNETIGSDSVNITAGWDSLSCNGDSAQYMSIAMWNGAKWKDLGGTGGTGNARQGSVIGIGVIIISGPIIIVHKNICVIHPLAINAGVSGSIIPGGSYVLGGSPTASGGFFGGYTYLWSPVLSGSTTILSSATVSNPVATPIVTTTYHLTVTGGFGCTKTAAVTVAVISLTANTEYAVMQEQLDGHAYQPFLGNVYFTLDGQYSNISLNYTIYDYKRSAVTTAPLTPTTYQVGDNRYIINVSALSSGAYVLEVKNEKNEMRYLRFKK